MTPYKIAREIAELVWQLIMAGAFLRGVWFALFSGHPTTEDRMFALVIAIVYAAILIADALKSLKVQITVNNTSAK